MSHLTRIEGVPDKDEVHDGMARFANTGPFATTCGQCKHRGYFQKTTRFNKISGEWEDARRRVNGCAKFNKLTGRHGDPVREEWPSCKYFERAHSSGEATK